MKNISLHGSELLGALKADDRALIAPHLDELHLKTGHIIHEPGEIVQHAYFPRHDALVAFLVPMADGESIEISMTGREGAVGGIVSHGQLPAFARCCVHHGGDFFRIPVAALEDAKSQSEAIRALFQCYADCMVAQLFQSIACNARHTIEQRAARWLCTSVNRTGTFEVTLTQAQLGGFLGVGRSYVTRIIARLKEQGIVSTRRGGIIIEKPRKLRALSCDCQSLIADHCGQVMKGVYSG
ncbi:MAG: Crp/Fnr family transcriptional regulator [Sphingobium sp.]|nr:Crp/Fnr family transcriptional regulator [Sphingobium sp.]